MAQRWWVVGLATLGLGQALHGCDLCAVASATESAGTAAGITPTTGLAGEGPIGAAVAAPATLAPESPARLTVGLLGEHRRAGTLRQDGDAIDDAADQYLDTTSLQLVAGWRFTPTWGVRMYVPLLYRSYRRATASGTVEGWYTGLGDVLIEGVASGQVRRDGRHFTVGNLFAGLELPTGDSDQLAYVNLASGGGVADSGHSHGGGGEPSAPDSVHDAVHPQSLALGSGSWDMVAGASGFARWGRAYLTGHGQYTFRTEGDYGYRYGSGVMFGAGPGVFLVERGPSTLGVHLNLTGQFDERDHHQGYLVSDSGMRELLLGPDLTCSWRGRLTGELGAEVPVWQDSHGRHLATDVRIHSGVSVRF